MAAAIYWTFPAAYRRLMAPRVVDGEKYISELKMDFFCALFIPAHYGEQGSATLQEPLTSQTVVQRDLSQSKAVDRFEAYQYCDYCNVQSTKSGERE